MTLENSISLISSNSGWCFICVPQECQQAHQWTALNEMPSVKERRGFCLVQKWTNIISDKTNDLTLQGNTRKVWHLLTFIEIDIKCLLKIKCEYISYYFAICDLTFLSKIEGPGLFLYCIIFDTTLKNYNFSSNTVYNL